MWSPCNKCSNIQRIVYQQCWSKQKKKKNARKKKKHEKKTEKKIEMYFLLEDLSILLLLSIKFNLEKFVENALREPTAYVTNW